MDIEQGTISSSSTLPSTDSKRSKSQKRVAPFIDYIPPPPRPIPPPAKYKLFLMVVVCVFFAEWFSFEAKFLPWLERTFLLSRSGGLFVLLGTIVIVLVYGTFDLLVFMLRIKNNGEWYGLGRWFKQPRIQWVHEYHNFPMELLARIVVLLEDGFDLFNTHKPPEDKTKEGPMHFDHDDDDEEEDDDDNDEKGNKRERNIILKIENRIRPGKNDEYEMWRKRLLQKACRSQPGLKNVRSERIPHKSEDEDDDVGDMYIAYLEFDSLDKLNLYMSSPVRARFIRKLQPLLAAPSLIQLRNDRVLPDAFTDLCTRQGQEVPTIAPKKWKVCFLTTFGLWGVVLFTNNTLSDHYYNEWHVDDAHERARSLVGIIFNVFLNTYVAVPFLTMIFGDWLKRTKENDNNVHEPWRTFDNGFSSIWGKIAITLAFYGSCVVAWIVHSSNKD